ncbi:MAG: sugar ABC transporter ATP-binding protein [Treponema sp.]|nr:sugar ABC transporter ATP-binding protein [Treponema sp.]
MAEEKALPMLSVKNVHKSFGSNAVLKGIDLDVYPGEVLAMIGGNGAGKSTLVKCIMGIHRPDEGSIFIDGKQLRAGVPSAALDVGVYLIPQEPMLFPNMTLEENVLMGIKGDAKELHKKLLGILDQLKWKLDLCRSARTLSIAEQQLVEILRGLMREARVMFFDEPTSSLTFDEVNSLFSIIKDLQKKKVSIIYITHRMNEVFEIANSICLLVDGVITMKGDVKDFTYDMLLKGLMQKNKEQKVSTVVEAGGSAGPCKKELVMSLKNFTGYGFADVNLDIYSGEILGMAGVVGAGRTELATTLFGRDKVLSGQVTLNGEDVTGLGTKAMIAKGVNYLPEDRFLNGIFKLSTVRNNVISACINKEKGVFVKPAEEKRVAQKYIGDFHIKVTGDDQIMGSLSGGNQQKVILGRCFSTTPKVVILDEPTRGVDAGARSDVYAIIQELKKTGIAIVLISSDMEEIMALSDRVVTMYRGRINHEFMKDQINEDNLMAASFGVTKTKEISK